MGLTHNESAHIWLGDHTVYLPPTHKPYLLLLSNSVIQLVGDLSDMKKFVKQPCGWSNLSSWGIRQDIFVSDSQLKHQWETACYSTMPFAFTSTFDFNTLQFRQLFYVYSAPVGKRSIANSLSVCYKTDVYLLSQVHTSAITQKHILQTT